MKVQHNERYKKIKDLVMDAMKKTFRPEFLNRIDEIIVFQQLTKEEIRRIVDIMSADLQGRIKAQGMELVITDECKDMLAKDGYNPTYGARPLRRSIQRLLEDALAEQVLQGNLDEFLGRGAHRLAGMDDVSDSCGQAVGFQLGKRSVENGFGAAHCAEQLSGHARAQAGRQGKCQPSQVLVASHRDCGQRTCVVQNLSR